MKRFVLLLVGIFVGVLVIAIGLTALTIELSIISKLSNDNWVELLGGLFYFAGFLTAVGLIGYVLAAIKEPFISALYRFKSGFGIKLASVVDEGSDGGGTEKKSRRTINQWDKDAKKGDAKAQVRLGKAYYNGDGVGKDPRKAFKLWNEAANQGNAEAQACLGAAFFEGKGVITDKHQSYIWFVIAKASGNDQATKIIDHESDWNKFLSRDERKSATEKAKERLAEIGKEQNKK